MAEGLFGEMADKVGYPFNQFPTEAFVVAAGGYAGTNTLCGALGVAATFIGVVCDRDQQKEVVKALWTWYEKENFPHYQPAGMNLTQTVANSVICYDSVGKFMEAEGVPYGDARRKERCAGVTAEVVKKTVELLNATLA